MSTHCSRRQVASAGGLGGADTAGAASVRQLAATAVLTVALWGARLVGVVWRWRGTRSVGWDRSRAGLSAGRDAAARALVGAKRTLWARPEHARDMLDEMTGQPRGRG